jgi:hypothetical protein
MRSLSSLTDDLSHRPAPWPRDLDTRYGRPGRTWLGCVAFGIAFWISVGFGIRALIVALEGSARP